MSADEKYARERELVESVIKWCLPDELQDRILGELRAGRLASYPASCLCLGYFMDEFCSQIQNAEISSLPTIALAIQQRIDGADPLPEVGIHFEPMAWQKPFKEFLFSYLPSPAKCPGIAVHSCIPMGHSFVLLIRNLLQGQMVYPRLSTLGLDTDEKKRAAGIINGAPNDLCVRAFCTPPASWSAMAGQAGFQVVRLDGPTLWQFTTVMN